MAQKLTVDLIVNDNVDETNKKILTLKQQLKAAKAEVLAMSDEFGVTSQQAIKAAEKAAELSHEIAAANKLVKAFNPSQTLNSTTTALGATKEGFEVVGSTMKSVGIESEGLEKSIKNVGLAMEISSGITTIQESATAFQTLAATVRSYTIVQKTITAGQWLWNAAMAANPIGVIVAGVLALVAAGYKLTEYFIDSAEANEKAEKATKKNTAALKEQNITSAQSTSKLKIYNDQQYALAEASGMSSDGLRKLALKHKEEEIALNKKNAVLAQSTVLREIDTLASLKNSGASDEVIKNQEKLTQETYKSFKKQNEVLSTSYKERAALRNSNAVAEVKENTEARKEAIKDAKEKAKERYELEKNNIQELIKNDKLSFDERRKAVNNDDLLKKEDKKKFIKEINAEELKKKEEHQKAITDLENKYKVESENAAAQTEQQKIDLKNQRNIEEINKLAQTEDEKKKLLLLAETQYQTELSALKLKNDQEKLTENAAKDLEDANNQKLSFEARLQAIIDREAIEKDIKFKSEKEHTDFKKANVDARKKLDDEESESKMKMLQAISGGLALAADELGQSTAAGKAAAVASATINTYAAIAGQLKAFSGVPVPGFAIAQAIVTGVTGLLQVKKILAVQVPGGGGGGASVGSVGAAPAAQAPPQFNVVGTSGTNQIAQSLGNQAPVKAYVVANDVTTQQSMDRNIVNTATIGN
jgi:hypothetical protein